ncbi:aldolase/citrate lyase family protein [Streptomyces scopuliridis]|uniref:aldolase/citrate lyase family protein n=1 Tax=Streptomyces scopuliridis TaxID=452529 RepID=UPI0036906A0A
MDRAPPGVRAARREAASSGADAVLLDLEDAVPEGNKARAREEAVAWPAQSPGLVRVNAVGSPWHADDLAALAEATALRGVVLPKSSTAPQVATVIGLREAAAIAGLLPVGPTGGAGRGRQQRCRGTRGRTDGRSAAPATSPARAVPGRCGRVTGWYRRRWEGSAWPTGGPVARPRGGIVRTFETWSMVERRGR